MIEKAIVKYTDTRLWGSWVGVCVQRQSDEFPESNHQKQGNISKDIEVRYFANNS